METETEAVRGGSTWAMRGNDREGESILFCLRS